LRTIELNYMFAPTDRNYEFVDFLEQLFSLKHLENINITSQNGDTDWQIQVYFKPTFLLVRIGEFPYDIFLDILDSLSARCPPELHIKPKLNEKHSNAFYLAPSPSFEKKKKSQYEFENPAPGLRIFIPHLVNISISGAPYVIASDILSRLTAPCLDRISIEIRPAYTPYNEAYIQINECHAFTFARSLHLSFDYPPTHLLIMDILHSAQKLTDLELEFVGKCESGWAMERLVVNNLYSRGNLVVLPLLSNLKIITTWETPFDRSVPSELDDNFRRRLEGRTKAGCVPLTVAGIDWDESTKTRSLRASKQET